MIFNNDSITNADIVRTLGVRFRNYRLGIDKTRKEVATEAGVGLTTIYKFETGNMTDISFGTLLRLLKTVGERGNWENLLPELPESPYLYKTEKKKQRVRHSSK